MIPNSDVIYCLSIDSELFSEIFSSKILFLLHRYYSYSHFRRLLGFLYNTS